MKNNKTQVPNVDVLLLHGRDLSLVDNVQAILASIGLTAAKVMDLPSLDLDLDDRADVYIKSSRLRVMIASYDEQDKGGKNARPNVHDEITRSVIKSSNDHLIVLRETKKGNPVPLASNIIKRLKVIVLFKRSKFALAIPKLLMEIAHRGLLKIAVKKADVESSTAAIIIPFMKKMDALWEKEFTVGWNKIHSSDADAVSKLTIHLDNFFIEYHKVFKALIRRGKKGKDLTLICEKAYEASLNYAAHAWIVVADSKRDEAKKRHDDSQSARHEKIYEDALHVHRQIERATTQKVKIDRARKVVSQFEKFIKKIR